MIRYAGLFFLFVNDSISSLIYSLSFVIQIRFDARLNHTLTIYMACLD